MLDSYILLGIVLGLATVLPLAWKWQLGVWRVVWFAVAVAIVSGLLVALLQSNRELDAVLRASLTWLLILMVASVVLVYRFYRDPERVAPDRDGIIVSPADGKVIYIREAQDGILPVSSKHGHNFTLGELTKTALQEQQATVIGISMNFLDVHVNRAPIAGNVTFWRHFPGLFGSLRRPEMVFENERATTIITSRDIEVAVVQIASRLVRQISSFVQVGQRVALGQRIGAIRLGSQVDVVLSDCNSLRVLVAPGEQVMAGQSIIAVYERAD